MSLAARALIVYHEQEDLNFVRNLLQAQDWIVDEAHDGEKALVCARENAPLIIISSLLMPIMDGLALLRQCKADEKLKQIPFIIYDTSYTGSRGEELGLALGATALVLEPSEPGVLIACIREALAKSNRGESFLGHEPIGQERILLKQYNEILIRWLDAHSAVSQEAAKGRTVVLAITQDVTDRKRSQSVARANHHWLRNVLDGIFTFVGILSTGGILREINRAPLEMADLRREDVIGKPLTETYWFSHSIPAQDRAQIALQRAARGEIVRYDEVIRAAGDRSITIDITFGPVRDDNGDVVEIVGSAVDVTDRKLAERALLESERQYRLLFNSSPLPMWIYDLNTLAFLAVNDAAILHYGYSRDEFLAMSVSDIKLRNHDSSATDDGDDAKVRPSANLTHRKKNGTVITVEITTHEMAFHGKAAQLILANDITERLNSVANLRQSEERFSTAFRSSPVAITIATQSDGRYVDVNEAFLKMMGYQWEEVIGPPQAS